MSLPLAGAALTAAVTVGMWVAWGRSVLLPGLVFGALATGIQWASVAVLRPVWGEPAFAKFVERWVIGMALRLGGVLLFLVAVLVDRRLFPPLPTALGYLGVVIPLLFLETRFVK